MKGWLYHTVNYPALANGQNSSSQASHVVMAAISWELKMPAYYINLLVSRPIELRVSWLQSSAFLVICWCTLSASQALVHTCLWHFPISSQCIAHNVRLHALVQWTASWDPSVERYTCLFSWVELLSIIFRKWKWTSNFIMQSVTWTAAPLYLLFGSLNSSCRGILYFLFISVMTECMMCDLSFLQENTQVGILPCIEMTRQLYIYWTDWIIVSQSFLDLLPGQWRQWCLSYSPEACSVACTSYGQGCYCCVSDRSSGR